MTDLALGVNVSFKPHYCMNSIRRRSSAMRFTAFRTRFGKRRFKVQIPIDGSAFEPHLAH